MNIRNTKQIIRTYIAAPTLALSALALLPSYAISAERDNTDADYFVIVSGNNSEDSNIFEESTDSAFELETTCENGTSQIGLLDANSNSYLSIGSISINGAVAEPTTKLLSPETRRWIAKRLMNLDDESSDSDIQADIASCLNIKIPEPSTSEGVLVCYPDENTSCEFFKWLCRVLDGDLGHNICYY